MLTGVDWRMYLVSHLTGRILIGNQSEEGDNDSRLSTHHKERIGGQGTTKSRQRNAHRQALTSNLGVADVTS